MIPPPQLVWISEDLMYMLYLKLQIGDTHPIITQQCGEVGSLKTVNSVHKFSTVHSICSCENTSWE
jgi:hypothetical protein